MRCPACGVDVEEGADLCLECGEPMGDGPAARVARAEVSQNAAAPKVGQNDPAPSRPTPPSIDPSLKETLRGKRSALNFDKAAVEREKLSALAETVRGKKKSPLAAANKEEPEAVRCPGCGTPTRGERCPACGTRVRREEE